MDLLKIYENVKKQEENEEKTKKEIEKKKEIRKLIADIILGKDIFYTNSKELCEALKIQYQKTDGCTHSSYGFLYYYYRFKLNKTNIAKIQKYLKDNDGGVL